MQVFFPKFFKNIRGCGQGCAGNVRYIGQQASLHYSVRSIRYSISNFSLAGGARRQCGISGRQYSLHHRAQLRAKSRLRWLRSARRCGGSPDSLLRFKFQFCGQCPLTMRDFRPASIVTPLGPPGSLLRFKFQFIVQPCRGGP